LLKNVFGVQIWLQTIANKRRCAVCTWQTLATGAKKGILGTVARGPSGWKIQ